MAYLNQEKIGWHEKSMKSNLFGLQKSRLAREKYEIQPIRGLIKRLRVPINVWSLLSEEKLFYRVIYF